MIEQLKPKRALLSVYDKTGLLDFAKKLFERSIEIISTGGTATFLKKNSIPVTLVSDITKFPEILEGRVKTLHPKIHGAILAKRSNSSQMDELEMHQISPIDLVVVNLYPFEKTVEDPNVQLDTALENIDIGGPCMIRAAAKNFPSVAVVTDIDQYDLILSELNAKGSISLETRKNLAVKAFLKTNQYDQAIYQHLNTDREQTNEKFPEFLQLCLEKMQNLRYGENPHQKAAFYKTDTDVFGKQLHGKELSFNNILDLYSAMGLSYEYTDPCAVVVKHNNPCGVALADTIEKAYEYAFQTDSLSAFGGVVSINKPVTELLARQMAKVFLEVIIAPSFSNEALDILTRKKNIRLIEWPEKMINKKSIDIKKVYGGYLFQETDSFKEDPSDYKVVTNRKPTQQEWTSMLFGWKVCKWVKSNAVIYVKGNRSLGIGAGQMSRVDASKLAVIKASEAGHDLKNSIVISDAFFPFRDGIDAASEAGAIGVIQPGGSKRDPEVIQAAEEHNMFMVMTGFRHFRH